MRRWEGRCQAMGRSALAMAACTVLLAGSARAQVKPAEQPQVPKLLKLSDAIDLALRGSTRLEDEEARLESTRKKRLNAWFDLGPDLSLSASMSKSSATSFDVPIDRSFPNNGTHDVFETRDNRQSRAAAAVRLFDGLANYMRVSAANSDIRAGQYSMAYTSKQVQTDAIAAYYNLLRAQMLLRVAQEAESVAKEQLDRTQALFDLGSAAKSDVLKSQVQHGNTRLDLVRARNQVRQTRVDLEYAMNLSTPVPFDIDSTVANIHPEPVNYEAERDFALRSRENLLSLRASEAAASSRAWAAKGALLPTVDFQYSFSRFRASGLTTAFLQSSNTHDRTWGFSANWNVWDRYANYAAIGQARANSRIAEYNRRQAELDAVREIRTFTNSLDESRERLDVARDNITRSMEDLRLAQEKFRVGAGTILDTITAESDLTSTKAAEVQAIVDYLIARAGLARATGRPFSEL